MLWKVPARGPDAAVALEGAVDDRLAQVRPPVGIDAGGRIEGHVLAAGGAGEGDSSEE